MKLTGRLLLLITTSLIIKSCKTPEISGVFKLTFQDSIELELKNNSYNLFSYHAEGFPNSDIVAIHQIRLFNGSYRKDQNNIILYDSIAHKNYSLTIINNEILISNSAFHGYKPYDTLRCKEKFYPNGKTEWEETGFNEKLNIRTYYDRHGSSIREFYYDRKRKITKVKNCPGLSHKF